ncbi:MAG: hypothetical protein ACHQDE_03115 [Acidimicrobiia bacterium]
MDDSKWERWSALGGALFVVLILVSGFLPGSPPKTSDSSQKIANFITDKAKEVRWSSFLGGLAVLALFWFAGAVWRFLSRAEGGSPRLTVVALLGALFAATMSAIGGVMLGVMGLVGVHGLGGVTMTRTYYLLSTALAGATAFGAAVFVAAFSAVVIRSGVLPKAMGWIGIVIAVVFVASGGIVASTRNIFFALQFGGFLAFSIWLIIISVMMFRAAPVSAPAPAPASAS